MLSQEFIQEMKKELLDKKAQLELDLADLPKHTEMGGSLEDEAEEVEVDEVNQDLIARIKSDLEKIDAALKRIEDGTYGVDSEGKEIPEARLKALPWADKAI